MAGQVEIYDVTLRDGAQGEGVNFSLEDKLRLSQALDDLGVHYIEGGWPGSNPKDVEYFAAMRKTVLDHAILTAFGSTRRAGNPADRDGNLNKIAAARPGAATIFGKTWDLHVHDALRVTLDENLDMIESSIRYLRDRVGRVFFDAEHFFDGYRENPGYALKCLEAALSGGAERVILCDTNGGRMVHETTGTIDAVRRTFPDARLGIHCHNDSGLAVANSVEAVMHGAELVQGCINGFGERTGNADLCSIIPILELKAGRRTVGRQNLEKLTNISRFAYELANLSRRDFQPFVGASAFAHKGGTHVSAMARNTRSYEAVEPESVGNTRRILISELAGRASVLARYPELAAHPDKMNPLLEEIMRRENDGFAYENADASFEMLLKRFLGRFEPSFELLGFRAATEERDGGSISEASVKVRIGDIDLHTVSEGLHGPVGALDLALRKALNHVFPFFDAIRLIDFRVHIVNAQAGTNAKVRVVIQSQEGDDAWGTVGVSENILNASCQALVDSFQYLVMRHGGKSAANFRRRLHQV
ncbi:MAG: citramalate synthase [Planctomycetota bacterium]|jgi:2-isopropylmalate synthase|nr:citramalate synthase [Planctomycetota bacterium]